MAGSGGAGTITADLTYKYGLKFPVLAEKTYAALVEVFPDWMPPTTFAFVDIWPAMEKAMMNNVKPEVITSRVYEALLNDPNVEGIFNMMFCSRQFKAMNNVDNLIANAKQASKPIFFWLIGEKKEVRRISQKLAANHLPNFPSLEEMVKNFSILVQKSKNMNLS